MSIANVKTSRLSGLRVFFSLNYCNVSRSVSRYDYFYRLLLLRNPKRLTYCAFKGHYPFIIEHIILYYLYLYFTVLISRYCIITIISFSSQPCACKTVVMGSRDVHASGVRYERERSFGVSLLLAVSAATRAKVCRDLDRDDNK